MTNTWTEQMLDRFMVAEICMDELRSIADEFPGIITDDQLEAICALQQGPWDGFVEEPLDSRGARMRRIRDRLQETFPCECRTHEEAALKAVRA